MEKKEYKLLDVAIELEQEIREAMSRKYSDSCDTIHVDYSLKYDCFYVSELPVLGNSIEVLACYYDELCEHKTFLRLLNNLREFSITFKTDSVPSVDFDPELTSFKESE